MIMCIDVFNPGDRVKVSAGPYTGESGTIDILIAAGELKGYDPCAMVIIPSRKIPIFVALSGLKAL